MPRCAPPRRHDPCRLRNLAAAGSFLLLRFLSTIRLASLRRASVWRKRVGISRRVFIRHPMAGYLLIGRTSEAVSDVAMVGTLGFLWGGCGAVSIGRRFVVLPRQMKPCCDQCHKRCCAVSKLGSSTPLKSPTFLRGPLTSAASKSSDPKEPEKIRTASSEHHKQLTRLVARPLEARRRHCAYPGDFLATSRRGLLRLLTVRR
jgi:hypothetical protein